MTHERNTYQQQPVPFDTIASYPSAALNKEPLLYPGIRPQTSFLLDGKNVYELSAEAHDEKLSFAIESADGTRQSLDTYLQSQGVEPMANRVPILAYGANMCPASIYAKFDKVGRPDAHIVPTLYGQLEDYDVVWSGGPGVNGNFIANLYTGQETVGTNITVGINFLTKEQLLVMHGTELSYDLTTVPVEIDGVTINALVYAGTDQILLKDGRPVAVDGIKAEAGTRQLPSSSTRELTGWMVHMPEVQALLEDEGSQGIATADEYVADTAALLSVKGKGAKLARKQAVHDVMATKGLSKVYKLPVAESALQTWANPSTVPTYGEQLDGVQSKDIYVLPSTEIPVDAWPDRKKRDLALRAISTHHMRMTGLKETEK